MSTTRACKRPDMRLRCGGVKRWIYRLKTPSNSALHAVQDRFGWLTPAALNYICERLTLPPAEVFGVVTFYHLFSLTPRSPKVTHVCDDIACRIKGAEQLCADMEKKLGPEGGEW